MIYWKTYWHKTMFKFDMSKTKGTILNGKVDDKVRNPRFQDFMIVQDFIMDCNSNWGISQNLQQIKNMR